MPSNRPDEHLENVLRMCEQMIELANRGDEFRKDAGCGVVYGALRDMGYKMRGLAEKELEKHRAPRTIASNNPKR
ncbi:MAG: hypothetical protein MUF54_20365 [Polyangiaceae bacterium]|jgi:hypothetical protein|nr:hypothetical protein [Polyangiaceae bacterium]